MSKLFELYDKEAKEIEQEKKKEEEKSKAASKNAPAKLSRPNTTKPALVTRAESIL